MFLEDVLVLENGRPGAAGAENIVLVSLIWPRPMIDLRTAAKSVRLEDGHVAVFSDKPFHEKILFKEIVGGPFGVTVEVTERKSPGVIAQFLAAIASDLVNAAFPLPPSSETFRRIVHAGVSGVGQKIRTAPRESFLRIAFGHALIDPATATSGRLEIPLSAPETLSAPSTGRSRKTPYLVRGQPNGTAAIRYRIEED